MKSIKPGRGPSMMSGAVGIFMVLFGIVWTILASQFFPLFSLFGAIWTSIALVMTIYNFKNATRQNRYSSFDIVDTNEEIDPLNQKYGNNANNFNGLSKENDINKDEMNFCPYCGIPVVPEYSFCQKCGKKLK